MCADSLLIVHTGKDGAFVDGAQAATDHIFETIQEADRIVLHFHGGLVDAQGGKQIAARLDPVYRAAGAQPIFFVWESGLLEVLHHNLSEIAGEDFFKLLLTHVLKVAMGKVYEGAGQGGRGEALAMPKNIAIHVELARRDSGEEPYSNVKTPNNVSALTDDEKAEFQASLSDDTDFTETVQAIADAVLPQKQVGRSRGIETRVRLSARTLLSPDVVEDLASEVRQANQAGARGVLPTAFFIKKAVTVLERVISRFGSKRDHGIYCTIVEELLREFYVANVGVKVWAAMKGETQGTFANGPGVRGGRYVAGKLLEMIAAGKQPKVTVVGHSTGAVFINNLLAHLQAVRESSNNAAIRGFALKHVVFLAPACTIADFSKYVTEPFQGTSNLFETFRLFTMTDEAEQHDVLVPYVYLRSLLYFISGVLEPGTDGRSTPDVPMVGMKRFYGDGTFTGADIDAVRTFVQGPERAVWAPTTGGGKGLVSDAVSHTAFDDDRATLESISAIIRD